MYNANLDVLEKTLEDCTREIQYIRACMEAVKAGSPADKLPMWAPNLVRYAADIHALLGIIENKDK